MRILLQRVQHAEVRIPAVDDAAETRVSGRIDAGYLLFVGFTHSDTEAEVRWMADKVAGLRLLADRDGRMNRDLREENGSILVVSQFTLYADARKGRRPSFVAAAHPDRAVPLYETFIHLLRDGGFNVATGEFGAMMQVELLNDGPVTIWLEREADSNGSASSGAPA